MRNQVPSTLCDCRLCSETAETIFGEDLIDFFGDTSMSYSNPKPPTLVLFSIYILQGRELEKHWTNCFFSSSLFLFPIFWVVFNWLVGGFFGCWFGLIFIFLHQKKKRGGLSHSDFVLVKNHSSTLFFIPIWAAWKTWTATNYFSCSGTSHISKCLMRETGNYHDLQNWECIWKGYLLIAWKS